MPVAACPLRGNVSTGAKCFIQKQPDSGLRCPGLIISCRQDAARCRSLHAPFAAMHQPAPSASPKSNRIPGCAVPVTSYHVRRTQLGAGRCMPPSRQCLNRRQVLHPKATGFRAALSRSHHIMSAGRSLVPVAACRLRGNASTGAKCFFFMVFFTDNADNTQACSRQKINSPV